MQIDRVGPLVLLACALLCFAWIVLRLRAGWIAWRWRSRLAHASDGQAQARHYLEQRGFRILAAEHQVSAELEVDGERVPYTVRLDYLVRKGRGTYGVEVKTGDHAGDPLYRHTRRQLLEYSCLVPLDGLYLLDMEARRLMRVRFPQLTSQPAVQLWLLPLCFLLGAVAALLLLVRR